MSQNELDQSLVAAWMESLGFEWHFDNMMDGAYWYKNDEHTSLVYYPEDVNFFYRLQVAAVAEGRRELLIELKNEIQGYIDAPNMMAEAFAGTIEVAKLNYRQMQRLLVDRRLTTPKQEGTNKSTYPS